jgi:hypothetical protein
MDSYFAISIKKKWIQFRCKQKGCDNGKWIKKLDKSTPYHHPIRDLIRIANIVIEDIKKIK